MPGQEPARDWQQEFAILRELDFFNHAGVAPLSNRAAQAMRAYSEQAQRRAYVGIEWYRQAKQVKALAARIIAAPSADSIAFVPNTSSGLALVAKGLDWRPGDQVVITDVEYPANRYPWIDLKRLGVDIIEVEEQPDGRIEVEDVCDAITDKTRVVAISHVQYASGCRIELKPIADLVHRTGGYLCVDAIQSVGVMPVDVEAMGIDFLAADGHKWMLGPEGCGFFYCRADLCELLHPNVVGWMNMVDATNFGDYRFEFEKDARRFEPGSYNIAGILGMGASLELLLEVGIDAVWSRVEALTVRLCAGLERKNYRVFSPRGDGERSGIVVFEPADPGSAPALARIVSELAKQNIIIVLREGRLRASPHFYNQPEQVDRLLAALP